MESASPEPKSSKTRGYFNKVRHPSQFSKPQLTVFILAFAVIGYLLVRVFAAAPLIATLESESMTPNIPTTTPGAGFVTTVTNNMTVNTPYIWAFNPPTTTSAGYFFADGKQLAKITGPGPYAFRLNPGVLTSGAHTLGHAWDTVDGLHQTPAQAYPVTINNTNQTGFITTLSQNLTINAPYLWAFDPGVATKTGYFYHGNILHQVSGPGPYAWVMPAGTLSNGTTKLGHAWDTSTGTHQSPSNAYNVTISNSSTVAPNASTISDTTASGGKAEKFSAGVALNGTVSLPNTGSSLTVVAHGEQCSSGGWPTMTVSLDGKQVLSTSVSSTSWTSFNVTQSMTAGSHSLSVANASSGACTPNLYADVTNFFGTVTPPAVTLTSNPTSVNSGSSSTLSWSSTNATSCSATNGWTTSTAVSGTQSVSPASSTTYVMTCTGSGGTTSAQATVTVTAATGGSLNIGETKVLTGLDAGNGNLLVAQSAALSQTATIQSLSFYVRTAAGNLRLGLYDSSGPNGGPGKLLASTNEIAPTAVGWDTANVTTPVSLNAGTYWLSYLASDNNLGFYKAQDSTSSGRFYTYAYGSLPSTFSTTPSTTASHWSFYASLNTSGTVTPPPPPPSPPPTGTIKFDGRAKNMVSMSSTGWSAPDGSQGTIVMTQSPQTWDCLCYDNNSVSLQPDSTFGKVYQYKEGPGNRSPWNNKAPANDASGQVSKVRPTNLGGTDYFALAIKVPSGWQSPDWSTTLSLGYETLAYDQIGLDINPVNGVPTWQEYNNTGYVNCPTTTCAGTSFGEITAQPVTFDQWTEFIYAIHWATDKTGYIKLYSRPIGGTWSLKVDRENIDTYLYGTTSYRSVRQDMSDETTVLDKQDLYYGYWNTATTSFPTETIYHSGFVRASDFNTAASTLP